MFGRRAAAPGAAHVRASASADWRADCLLYPLSLVAADMQPIDWLTVGLLLFAGAQVWVQARTEYQRRRERQLDADEGVDRAFQYVWAEHFRLEGLADELERRDLIELALLGVLRSEDALARDWSSLTEAMACLGREAGFLGGMASGLSHDVGRSIAILVSSVQSFASTLPEGLPPAQRVVALRQRYGEDLAPWEDAVRNGVRELAKLVWDAANQYPRAAVARRLKFSDDLSSEFARAAVRGLQKRASEDLRSGERPPE